MQVDVIILFHLLSRLVIKTKASQFLVRLCYKVPPGRRVPDGRHLTRCRGSEGKKKSPFFRRALLYKVRRRVTLPGITPVLPIAIGTRVGLSAGWRIGMGG